MKQPDLRVLRVGRGDSRVLASRAIDPLNDAIVAANGTSHVIDPFSDVIVGANAGLHKRLWLLYLYACITVAKFENLPNFTRLLSTFGRNFACFRLYRDRFGKKLAKLDNQLQKLPI